ncbi:MAG: ATP-binding protein [Acidimicrobiales bacterium]
MPRDAETVSLVRAAAGEFLRSFGVESECLEDIRLAVSEACTNVVQHARAGDEYEVRVHLDEYACTIQVRNVGSGFDAGTLEGAPLDPMSSRGRGVVIMRAVMDTVGFESEPELGTIVHLVRDLDVVPDSPLVRLRRP